MIHQTFISFIHQNVLSRRNTAFRPKYNLRAWHTKNTVQIETSVTAKLVSECRLLACVLARALWIPLKWIIKKSSKISFVYFLFYFTDDMNDANQQFTYKSCRLI